jgi:hypothetical protein
MCASQLEAAMELAIPRKTYSLSFSITHYLSLSLSFSITISLLQRAPQKITLKRFYICKFFCENDCGISSGVTVALRHYANTYSDFTYNDFTFNDKTHNTKYGWYYL